MVELDALSAKAMAKRKTCEIESTAYRLWLSLLMPANLILVVGAGLLSLLAGASLLVDQQIISKTATGLMALISSAFTLVHTRLKCDEHQAECRKLQSFYRGLAVDYANLETEADPAEFKTRLDSLNNSLAQVQKEISAYPSQRSYAKAKRIVESCSTRV